MPLLPPVITATFPSSFFVISFSFVRVFACLRHGRRARASMCTSERVRGTAARGIARMPNWHRCLLGDAMERGPRPVPLHGAGTRLPPMNAETNRAPVSAVAADPTSAEEPLADVERRLDEAAAILAETLLDMWRRERRARLYATSEGES